MRELPTRHSSPHSSFILDPPLVSTKESKVNNTEQLCAIKRKKNEKKKKREVFALARASLVCVKTSLSLAQLPVRHGWDEE